MAIETEPFMIHVHSRICRMQGCSVRLHQHTAGQWSVLLPMPQGTWATQPDESLLSTESALPPWLLYLRATPTILPAPPTPSLQISSSQLLEVCICFLWLGGIRIPNSHCRHLYSRSRGDTDYASRKENTLITEKYTSIILHGVLVWVH